MPTAGETRLSLWAMPTAHDSSPFAARIQRLATTVGAPTFAPHVTLVGSVPRATAGRTIANALAAFGPFEVTLVGLADTAERFRCITVLVVPTSPLTEMRATLVAVCGVDPAPYQPHLSLLYANLGSAERKDLRDTLVLPLPMAIEIDTVCLVDTTDEDPGRWTVERRWGLGATA